MEYTHRPVLLDEVLEGLDIQADGVYVDGPSATSAYVPGKQVQALDLQNGDFSTGGDYISLSYVMTDSGTISMWYKVNNLYNYASLFDNSVQQDDWEMWIYGDSRLRFRIQSDNPVTANLNSLAPDGDARGDWFHIVAAWERTGDTSADTMLYVNGDFIQKASGSWVEPGSTFYLAGGHNNNDYGDGIWDDVRIYERVLTLTEIRLLTSMSDFDEDKDVDIDDFATFVNQWLVDVPGCDSSPLGDFTVDCKVNLDDIAHLAQFWLESMN